MMSSTLASYVPPHCAGAEARGRVGEIDRPVRRHDDGVGIADRIIGRSRDRSARVTRPSGVMASRPFMASAAIMRPCGIEVEAEYAPARVGEDLLLAAVRLHAQQVAACHRRVELAVRSDRDVLRADLAPECRSCADPQAACSAHRRRCSPAASAPAMTRALRERARDRDRRRRPPARAPRHRLP